MENTSVFEQKVTWEEFATIRYHKKQLRKHSKKKELSTGTWKSMRIYFPGFLKFYKKTPDELIEESLIDSEIGEERLDEYFHVLKEIIAHNSARVICYALFQGFYSHNKVNTKNWTSPEPHPTKVKSTDDNFPIWKYNEDIDEFELNRPLLQDFFNRLNPTYRSVAFALIGTGQDIGIILKRDVGFVRNQDYRHTRLSLNDNRSKTGEIIDGFYSEEATNAARSIVSAEMQNAADNDPLYVSSIPQRKREFRIIHGRSFQNNGIDILPPGRRLTSAVVQAAFRKAQKAMGIKITKGQQGPLRPKRIGRKIFRTAAEFAGFTDDRTRKFLAHNTGGGRSSGVYMDSGREIQERQYMKLERFIWIFKEPELSAKEKETTKELRRQLDVAIREKDMTQQDNDRKFERLERLIDDKWELSKKNPNFQ